MGTYVPPLPVQNFIPTKTVVTSAWLNQIDHILQGQIPAAGIYQGQFVSGQVQVTGPSGYMTSYGDLTFGLSLPGPGGVGPSLLIGGAGKDHAQIITDAQIPGLAGIDMFISAGDTDPSGTARGGTLWDFGGASFGGQGGARIVQAGTSVHGPGGDVQIKGGNNGNGDAAAGNVYILAGTTGNAGGNIKIYATSLGGNAGDISFWLGQPDIPHSVPLWTMSHTGALFPANQGAGNSGDVLVSAGNLASPSWGPPGLAGTIAGSLSGSMTVTPALIHFSTNGRQVSLWSEQLSVGTSTGFNDVIFSTLPSFLIPSQIRIIPCSGLQNNGIAQQMGVAIIDTFGGVTMSLTTLTSHIQYITNSWAATSQKGITTGWAITYPL